MNDTNVAIGRVLIVLGLVVVLILGRIWGLP